MAGLYIHIPFCKQRCRYCAFYSTTLNDKRDEYTHALCRELTQRKEYAGEPVSTIYFGGGTPTMLNPEQIERIMHTIKENYAIAPEPEITIECNPDDLTPERLTSLAACGFNRISMGVQTFDDDILKTIGRRHTAAAACKAVENARAAGFSNISIDLIFALPGSTPQSWLHDLRTAISLRPTHISAYNLMYEENTPLLRDLEEGKITELSEEENLQQFTMLIDELKKAGYRHYEISNFALPGYESRHNSSYWCGTPYTGCGAAAHSYNGTERRWNVASVTEYIKGINSGAPLFESETLTTEEKYNDTVLTRLRTADGLPLHYIKKEFGDTLYNYMMAAVRKGISAGNLRETADGCLTLTPKGIFVSDAVIREFIFVE